ADPNRGRPISSATARSPSRLMRPPPPTLLFPRHPCRKTSLQPQVSVASNFDALLPARLQPPVTKSFAPLQPTAPTPASIRPTAGPPPATPTPVSKTEPPISTRSPRSTASAPAPRPPLSARNPLLAAPCPRAGRVFNWDNQARSPATC